MARFLDEAVLALGRLGVWSVFIPFVLGFTIVFALLQKTKVLGNKSTKYNAIISFVFAMVFVYFVDLEQILYFTFYVVLLLLGVLMFMILIHQMGFEKFEDKNKKWIIIGVFLFVIIVFARQYIDWEIVKDVLFNPATIMLAVFLVGILVIVGKKPADVEEKAKMPEEVAGRKPVVRYKPEQERWKEPKPKEPAKTEEEEQKQEP